MLDPKARLRAITKELAALDERRKADDALRKSLLAEERLLRDENVVEALAQLNELLECRNSLVSQPTTMGRTTQDISF